MTVLTNARVHTLDERGTVADTLVVRDGRVAFVGPEERGQPGGRRAHARPRRAGRAARPRRRPRAPHVPGARAHDARRRRPRRGSDRRRARGDGRRRRDRGRVDQRAGLGSEPLARAGVSDARPRSIARRRGTPWRWSASTGTPPGSTRRRSAKPGSRATRLTRRAASSSRTLGGEPTGLLIDTAQRLVQRVEPLPSEARFDEAVRAAIAECLSLGLTGIARDGGDPVRARLVSAARRARAVPVPELRRGGRPLGGDLGLLPGARAGGDRRRPGDRARAQAHVGWRARLARGRAALAVLRRSRQPRAPADSRRGAGAAHERGRRARLSGLRPRHRRSRQHAHARHVRAGPGAPARGGAARPGCASSTRRSSPRRTSRGSARSAWCRACRRRIAPRTWSGPSIGSAPSGSRARMPGARCSAPASSSPGDPTFPSRARIRSTASTPRSRGGPARARTAGGSPSSA